MFTLFFDLVVNVVLTLVGIAFGWWLRSMRTRTVTLVEDESPQETQRAREALARLHELAARVAADVGEHSHRVEAINDELTALDSQEPDVVVNAVAKLVEANNAMQRQLASAEDKLQEQARQIQTQTTAARTDPLTQLFNRRAFDDEMGTRLAEFAAHGRNFCVAIIDVDHFKKFNDTYGHLAGDEVLRALGRLLRRSTRQSDFCARYGGEEFTVIFPGTTISEVLSLVERMRAAVAAEVVAFNGTDLTAHVSIGVAQYLRDEASAALVERADAALYAAKTAGRNRCHYHDGREIHPCRPETPAARREPAKPSVPEAPPAAKHDAERGPQDASPNPLLRLANRTAFCTGLGNRLAEARRGGSTPSILLVQVDRYEEQASLHGRPALELILRTTAKFLLAAVRDMDLVGHYDLGTFAMMFPNTAMTEAAQIAERLRRVIAACNLPWESKTLQFTVSLGGAEGMADDDLERILRRAEHALEAAVKSGGNSSYYHNGQWSETASSLLESGKAS